MRLAGNYIRLYTRVMPNPIHFPAPVRIGQKYTIAPGGNETLESYPNELLDDLLDSYTKEGVFTALQYRAFTRFSKDATWMTLDEFHPIWVESAGSTVTDIVVANNLPALLVDLLSFHSDDDGYVLTFSGEDASLWLAKDQNVLVITR